MSGTAEVAAVSLAQREAADIRQRLAAIDGQIRSVDAEIKQLEDGHVGDWRAAAADPAGMERGAEDLAKAHRRRDLTLQVREKARADLAAAERQVLFDRFQPIRAEADSLMKRRTARVRDILATVEQLAAMITEVDGLGREANSLFGMNRSETALTFTEATLSINRAALQPFIEELLASRLEVGLWQYGDRRPFGRFESGAVERIDAERTGLLVEMDAAMKRAVGLLS